MSGDKNIETLEAADLILSPGYPRVRVWLKKAFGLNVNHKRVYRLMKELGIRARIRRRKPYFGRREAGITSTNVLNRNIHATAPNTKWVTDVTYLPIGSGFLYILPTIKRNHYHYIRTNIL